MGESKRPKEKESHEHRIRRKAEELGISEELYGRYVPKGEFLDCVVIEDIEKDIIFICPKDTRVLYRYNPEEGIYTSDGDCVVKVWLSDRINPLIKKSKREEIVEKIKIRHYIDPTLINSGKDLIIMANGIYNISNDEFNPHTPEVIATAKIPVLYDPNAKCGKIDKFMHELVYEKDVKTLYEIMGYCLCRDYPIRKAFIFYGDTKNGKSTLIDLMQTMLGPENTRSLPLQQLEKDQWSVKSLSGMLANMCADISGDALESSARFRELVGNDRITIRTMHSEGTFMFKNYAKLIFSANKVPMPSDDLNSFYNRILTVTFPNTFEGERADPDIIQKIATKEELSGFFLKCVDALKMLLERRKFSGTLSDELNKEQYKRMCNPMQSFMDDFFVSDDEGFMAIDDFQWILNSYLSENSLPLMTDKKIYSAIQTVSRFRLNKYRPMKDGDRKRGIQGMKLKKGVEKVLELKKKDNNVKLEMFLQSDNDDVSGGLSEEVIEDTRIIWNNRLPEDRQQAILTALVDTDIISLQMSGCISRTSFEALKYEYQEQIAKYYVGRKVKPEVY